MLVFLRFFVECAERENQSVGLRCEFADAGSGHLRAPADCTTVRPVFADYFGHAVFRKTVLHRTDYTVVRQKVCEHFHDFFVVELFCHKENYVIFFLHFFGQHRVDFHVEIRCPRDCRALLFQRGDVRFVPVDKVDFLATFRDVCSKYRSERTRSVNANFHISSLKFSIKDILPRKILIYNG